MEITNAKVVRYIKSSEIEKYAADPRFNGRIFVVIEGSFTDPLSGFERTFRKPFLLVPDCNIVSFIGKSVTCNLAKSPTIGISCCLSLKLNEVEVPEAPEPVKPAKTSKTTKTAKTSKTKKLAESLS